MRTRHCCAVAGLILAALCPPPAVLADTPAVAPATATDAATVGAPPTSPGTAGERDPAALPVPAAPLRPAATDDPVPGKPLKLGLELYSGGSTLDGHRFLSDGMWAGTEATYPSVLYGHWENGKGHAAKLALGLGRSFHGRDRLYDQPSEAWWQLPAGPLSVTVGKFWVPFAAQEWEYETKPGLMLQWSHGANSIAAAANRGRHGGNLNAYLHASHNFGDENTVGVSLAAGKGLSFDSVHDRGWGLDASYGWRGWRLTTEQIWLRAPGARDFHFNWIKLGYQRLGAFEPYVGRYDWQDDADELGSFRSTVCGLAYQLNANLALEAAWAMKPGKDVSWLQFHWSWEK